MVIPSRKLEPGHSVKFRLRTTGLYFTKAPLFRRKGSYLSANAGDLTIHTQGISSRSSLYHYPRRLTKKEASNASLGTPCVPHTDHGLHKQYQGRFKHPVPLEICWSGTECLKITWNWKEVYCFENLHINKDMEMSMYAYQCYISYL